MIEITMPVPNGIDPSKAIVINYNPYYYGSAAYQYIVPTQNADGTYTFIIENTPEFVVAEVINIDYDKNNFATNILETLVGQNKILGIRTKEGVVFAIDGLRVDPKSVGIISFDTFNDQNNNLVVMIRNSATELKTPITIFARAQSENAVQTLYFVNANYVIK